MLVLVLAPPYTASEPARALHAKLFIAQLHDDALLWSRGLLQRCDCGHADFARRQEGGVRLQVCSTVAKPPKGLNFVRNAAAPGTACSSAQTGAWGFGQS